MGQVGCFIQDSRQDSCNHVSVRGVIMKNSKDQIRYVDVVYVTFTLISVSIENQFPEFTISILTY